MLRESSRSLGFGSYPDWSPDGDRIVFNTRGLGSFQDTTKASNLYTMYEREALLHGGSFSLTSPVTPQETRR